MDLLPMLAAAAGNAGEEADEDFANTVLLLHGDGTNGAQNNTFLDSSTNNFTITRAGNTMQGTSPFSKPDGRWGNYFDGSGDYIRTTTGTTTEFDLSSGDFTIEAWIYLPTVTGTYQYVCALTGVSGGLVFGINPSGQPYVGNGVVIGTSGSTAISANTWTHICVVKNGANTQFYTNGVANGSSFSFSPNSATNIFVGLDGALGNPLTGWMSNVRLVKGTAVYTSAFTPSTTPLTAIANTQFLSCQSNRFVDNSSNAFAITAAGNVKVTPFSPFPITTAYSPSVNGGAGYFDGSGDYLSIANNAAFDFGTGSLTVEVWIYTGVKTDFQSVIGTFDGGSNAWFIHTNASGTITYGIDALNPYAGSTQVCDNSWHHIAMVRNGASDLKLYVDGVLDGSQTNSTNVNTNNEIRIGSLSSGATRYFTGYITNVRVTNTAVYTSAFTPPTAPPTAVSGTSLLCNFTNAGIFDNTGFNALETVGNAQIDTTTKKYGTGSIEFDGTGDRLVISPDNPLIRNWAEGDVTIEFWVYGNAWSSGGNGNSTLIAHAEPAAGGEFWSFGTISAGTVRLYYWNGSSGNSLTTTTTISTGTFYHLALTKSGTTLRIFIDGVVSATGTVSGTPQYSASVPVMIGFGANNVSFNGFIDDLRITKGIARYTTTFTPPTKAFPDIGS